MADDQQPPSTFVALQQLGWLGYLVIALGVVFGGAALAPEGSRRVGVAVLLILAFALVPVAYRASNALVEKGSHPAARVAMWALPASALAGSLILALAPSNGEPESSSIEQYITTDRFQRPPLLSTDGNLLGISNGTTVAEIEAMFPPEAEHRATNYDVANGPVYHSWTWRGLYVSITEDAFSETTTDLTVSVTNEDVQVLPSAPRGLLLGASTVADLVEAYGQPETVQFVSDEGLSLYKLGYYFSAENSLSITYTAESVSGAANDALSFDFCEQTIYAAEMAPIDQDMKAVVWPGPGLC